MDYSCNINMERPLEIVNNGTIESSKQYSCYPDEHKFTGQHKLLKKPLKFRRSCPNCFVNNDHESYKESKANVEEQYIFRKETFFFSA